MKQITFIVMALFSYTLSAQYFTESFESPTFPPAGWTVTNTNANQNWRIITGLSGGGATVSPTDGAQTAGMTFDVALMDETLRSPSIDLTTATNPRLTMDVNLAYEWAVNPNDNYDVTISVQSGLTRTTIWTEADLGVFTTLQWQNLELDLTPYVGTSINIIINYFGADGDYLLIDNMVVEETPSCLPAANLTFDAFTDTTADISWDNAGDYTIEYGVFPYAQGGGGTTVSVTNDTSYQLANLSPAVSYDVYVTQDCGANGTSSTETITIGTRPATVATYPYTEDFEVAPDQALILNLGVSRAQNTNPWSFRIDDLTDGDTTNDFSFSGVASFFSNNTFTTTDADATIYVGPYDLTTTNLYTFSIQQRNLAIEDATRPNKDIELVVTATPDGTANTVIATFDDMNNDTYLLRSGTFTPPTNGSYFFGVRDKSNVKAGISAGNSVFVDDFLVTAAPLSINDVNARTINAFYNNNTSSLNYNSSSIVEGIQVYNMVGGLVNDFKVNDTEGTVSTELKSGVYIASFTTQTGTQSIKFIVR